MDNRQKNPSPEQEAQLRCHQDWVLEYQPEEGWERDKGRTPSPKPFTGDWSEVSLPGGSTQLRFADFRGVQSLKDAELAGGTDLRGASFEGVDLRRVDFQDSRLDGASFCNADLRGARLRSASGLGAESFGGADLAWATLPKDFEKFHGLERVGEASRYSQTVYKLLLVLCGFSALTVLSVRDESWVLRDGASTTHVPFLEADLSPHYFAALVPVLILVLYGYQALYAASLWRLYSLLPAIFPDGTPLDRMSYPSTMSAFVRYSTRKIKNRPNDWFSYFVHWSIAFLVPPATLVVIWLTGLKEHDPLLSSIHSVALGVSWSLALFHLLLSGSVLRGEWRISDMTFAPFWKALCVALLALAIAWATVACLHRQSPGARGLVLVVASASLLTLLLASVRLCRHDAYAEASWGIVLIGVLAFLALSGLSRDSFGWRNYGLKPVKDGVHEGGAAPVSSLSERLSFWFSQTVFNPFLDFRNKALSRRPDDWSEDTASYDDLIKKVRGADLEGVDLRSLDAEQAFLAKANLRGADLRGAYLRFANLCEADLSRADLRGAYLRGANFREADLRYARLEDCIFSTDLDDPRPQIGPSFQYAKLDYRTGVLTDKVVGALIRGGVNNFPLAFFGVRLASEWECHPQLKRLRDAGVPDITDPDLVAQTIVGKRFRASFPLNGADFTGYNLSRCGFEAGIDLQGARFHNANLQECDFRGAQLAGADFGGADLTGADFTKADLTGATFTGSTWPKAKAGFEDIKPLIQAIENHPPGK
jgi:uncharacterized protein YjbI with pentapeptide repeats